MTSGTDHACTRRRAARPDSISRPNPSQLTPACAMVSAYSIGGTPGFFCAWCSPNGSRMPTERAGRRQHRLHLRDEVPRQFDRLLETQAGDRVGVQAAHDVPHGHRAAITRDHLADEVDHEVAQHVDVVLPDERPVGHRILAQVDQRAGDDRHAAGRMRNSTHSSMAVVSKLSSLGWSCFQVIGRTA